MQNVRINIITLDQTREFDIEGVRVEEVVLDLANINLI